MGPVDQKKTEDMLWVQMATWPHISPSDHSCLSPLTTSAQVHCTQWTDTHYTAQSCMHHQVNQVTRTTTPVPASYVGTHQLEAEHMAATRPRKSNPPCMSSPFQQNPIRKVTQHVSPSTPGLPYIHCQPASRLEQAAKEGSHTTGIAQPHDHQHSCAAVKARLAALAVGVPRLSGKPAS